MVYYVRVGGISGGHNRIVMDRTFAAAFATVQPVSVPACTDVVVEGGAQLEHQGGLIWGS
jgi:hypothetical protein